MLGLPPAEFLITPEWLPGVICCCLREPFDYLKALVFLVESENRLSLPVTALAGDLYFSAAAPALVFDFAAELCMLLLAFMLPFELLLWYRFAVVVEVTVFWCYCAPPP